MLPCPRRSSGAASPRIRLIDLIGPQTTLTTSAMWNQELLPIVDRTLAVATEIASARGWL